MSKRKYDDASVWEKLVAANDTIGSLPKGDWMYANKGEQEVIADGLSSIRLFLTSVVGKRKLTNSKEYSPFPKGETLHYRDLSQAQIKELQALVDLEHLWNYKRNEKNTYGV